MERRTAKLIIGKAGGTAGKNFKTYKLSIPSKWITELDPTDSKMEIVFDGDRIIISPHLSMIKDVVAHPFNTSFTRQINTARSLYGMQLIMPN